jgi:hypothetical protein
VAFTAAQLAAIEEAMASGELTVSYEGKTVTYRSMNDLKQARDMIRAELEATGVIGTATRRSYAQFSKD